MKLIHRPAIAAAAAFAFFLAAPASALILGASPNEQLIEIQAPDFAKAGSIETTAPQTPAGDGAVFAHVNYRYTINPAGGTATGASDDRYVGLGLRGAALVDDNAPSLMSASDANCFANNPAGGAAADASAGRVASSLRGDVDDANNAGGSSGPAV